MNSFLGKEPLDNEESLWLQRAPVLLDAQVKILRSIAMGEKLKVILEKLINFMEQESQQAICSVLTLDESGKKLHFMAAPSLPQAYNDYIEGLLVGPCQGSCGTSIYRRQPVQVTDIATDPLWKASRNFALSFGLKACTSVPILSSQSEPLGTFAFYYRQPIAPSAYDLILIYISRDLASIAIERDKRENERQKILKIEQQARQEAEHLSKVKDEFLAVASHELRAPVVTLALHLQDFEMNTTNFLNSNKLSDSVRNYIKEEKIYIEKLSKLLNNLLDTSTIRSNKLKLKYENIDIVSLIKRIVRNYQYQSDTEINLIGVSQLFGQWDSIRLEQVITNLLDNALKYGEGKPVNIIVSQNNDTALIHIIDHGPGISENIQSQIFNSMKQPHPCTISKGLGLGLYLVNKIVSCMGGRVVVEKNISSQGTAICIELPLSPT